MESQITQFKQFARNHPKLVAEVRSQERSWKEIYEEWVIYGEDHEIWEPYRSKKMMPGYSKEKNVRPSEGERSSRKQKESSINLLSLLKSVDIEDLQAYASQIGGVLTNVQKFVERYQSSRSSGNENDTRQQYMRSQHPDPHSYGPYPPQQNPYNYYQ